MESLSSAYGLTHLTQAVVHYNEALLRRARGAPNTYVAEALFHCLNQLQSGMAVAVNADNREIAKFTRLVRMGTSSDVGVRRFLGPELRAVASLQPQVMSHRVLRRHEYDPDTPIDPRLLGQATRAHRELVNALNKWERSASDETLGLVVNQSAELLYLVRSNVSHGEKTPYGPDVAKRERDENVCRLVVPVQLVLIDLLLDQPRQKLVVYGTLAPGASNHALVESLGGTWLQCSIEARVATHHGLPVLAWQPGRGSPPVSAAMLHSEELSDYWLRLDAFEGGGYRRELIVAAVPEPDDASAVCVANVYVGAHN